MGRFVSISAPKAATAPTEKYVKQTYEALSNVNLDLERVAIQISQLPVREQKRFFRLLINYADVTANLANQPHWSTLNETIILCERIMELVNNYYEEQEQIQLAFEGM